MKLFGKKKQVPTFTVGANQNTLHENLSFTAVEQYKLLRTNLKYVLSEDEKCPVIGVTSSTRGEGKSTTSTNLSYVLAQTGEKVLLIDGDLRLPTIAKKMGIKNSMGLTELLMDKKIDLETLRSPLLDNWYILLSGEIPPNPSELLGSRRMETVLNKLKEYFDYIVIDLPPVNIVSDAVSISRLISGMVVVIREEHTTKREVESCIRQLELADVNILGCVTTCSKSAGGAYGRYKYKRYGNYKSYGQNDTKDQQS